MSNFVLKDIKEIVGKLKIFKLVVNDSCEYVKKEYFNQQMKKS